MVSSSLATSFSFPFPFPSSKLNPHNPNSLEFRRRTPSSRPSSSSGPISRIRKYRSPRANSSTMAAVFLTSWPMAHMPSAHSFVASRIPSISSKRTRVASTCASASFLTELVRAHIARSIPVVLTGGSTTRAAEVELVSPSLDESSDSVVAFETTHAFFRGDAIALSGRLDTPVPATWHLTRRFAHWTHTCRPFPLGHLQVNPSRSHPSQTFATGSGSCIHVSLAPHHLNANSPFAWSPPLPIHSAGPRTGLSVNKKKQQSQFRFPGTDMNVPRARRDPSWRAVAPPAVPSFTEQN